MIVLGFERLLASPLLRGRRIGLVCNPASVGGEYRHVQDALTARADVRLTALFGPQHGFRADVQDNMIETPHALDASRRVPIYSLYSETREPTADMLREVDVLVIDLQDVGTRVYTFVYTMANCLRAAARHGVPVIVCDRPNPIGGELVEGPLLDEAYTSFVGQFSIPMRHGLTIGELAQLFNEAFGLGADLQVMTMAGWTREMYFDETGLPWIMPSPNMPTLDTAIVYPGAVLFEGTNVSEGRGTTRPFELVGAPWVDPERLAARAAAAGLPGVHFRPVVFEPTFHKHAGQACGGCQVHVRDRRAFRPLATAVLLLQGIRDEHPAAFAWRPPPYEYEHEKTPIDILWGSTRLRDAMEAGTPIDAQRREWAADEARFEAMRRPFLLY